MRKVVRVCMCWLGIHEEGEEEKEGRGRRSRRERWKRKERKRIIITGYPGLFFIYIFTHFALRIVIMQQRRRMVA